MNWVLTVLGPKQLQVKTLREMTTLAAALDQIAAGHPGGGYPGAEAKGL